ncbi:MAG: DsrE family protein [Pseudomonadales bacterium]
MKTILYLHRRPPKELVNSLEALQAAVVSSIFEQQVSLLFRDEGVRLLFADGLEGAAEEHIESWKSSIAEAEDYGITRIYACQASLESRKLQASRLAARVQVISEPEQTQLIASQDVVVSD